MKLFQLTAQWADAGQADSYGSPDHPMHGKVFAGYGDQVREHVGKIMAREARLVNWDLRPVEVEAVHG